MKPWQFATLVDVSFPAPESAAPAVLNAAGLVELQDCATTGWHHAQAIPSPDGVLLPLALAQHRANFDLWHQEDDARSPMASDATIAEVKHTIDRLNQQRNDLVEQIDEFLLSLAGPQDEAAPLHSETPGLIIDRLSILSLKIFHTDEEVHRPTGSDQHHERNRQRLAILVQQRSDLVACLDALWADVLSGRRRFRLYRQMKMYNDPELNPVLYSRQR
jgi:hypothetical protein